MSGIDSDADKRVIVFATSKDNTFVLEQCIHLLKIKKLQSYHLHVTTVTQDEAILSDLVFIKELNGRLFLHQTDIHSDESVARTISNVMEMEGKIDALVCQMEKRISASSINTTLPIIDEVFDKNFYPHLRFISNALPHMKRVKRGKIIMLNSYAGLQGLAYSSAYCVSRFALNGLLQSVAAEVIATKIRVCILQTVLRKSPTSLLLAEEFASSQENLLTSLDREHLRSVNGDLEKQNLLKSFSSHKLVTALKTLLTKDIGDLKVYMNKACKQKASEKFIDHKGTSTLSDIAKFYLNIDIDEFCQETLTTTSTRRRQSKLQFVKELSPFSCTGQVGQGGHAS